MIPPGSEELLSFPFLFMTGHKLVRFTHDERDRLRELRRARRAAVLGRLQPRRQRALRAQLRSRRCRPSSPTRGQLPQAAAEHALCIAASSPSTTVRRPTSHELNGWGDEIVHDYLRGLEHRGRLGVLYSNKDYGCEWDYDWRNKRFQREDNTKFAVNLVVYAMTA